MEYIRSNEIDPKNTLFHFSRIDNRISIEKNGLQAVAGGENEAANDKNNKTIYFSKGIAGILKAVDVWARWEYDKYARQEHSKGHEIKQEYEEHIIEGEDDSYDKDIMTEVIFDKLYDDFKNRQYYTVDLIEGKDGDFEFGDIDVKKILSRDKQGRPYPGSLWKYGPYSDFGTLENPNNKQEEWNMNTKTGDRTISADRLKIVETMDGRSDGLSVIIEAYNQYRGMIPKENDELFEILDNFIAYAKERYKNDRDFKKGSIDYGKRDINADEQKKYQTINQINLNKTKKNRLFSFISKIINKIKSTTKRKDVKMLPKATQVIREKSSPKSNSRNELIESLRFESTNNEQNPFPSDEEIVKNMNINEKFYSFNMEEIDTKIRIPKLTKNGEQLYLYRKNVKSKQLGAINYKIQSVYYIINKSGEIVGRVPISISNPTALNMDYWIKDEFQGQGIGSVVLEEIVRQIYNEKAFNGIDFKASKFPETDKTEIQNIQLEISDDNDASIRIATKNGFSKIGERSYALTLKEYLDKKQERNEI